MSNKYSKTHMVNDSKSDIVALSFGTMCFTKEDDTVEKECLAMNTVQTECLH